MVGTEEPLGSNIFRALENGRYEPIDCPSGLCERVRVAEIPYERQVDEDDDQYAHRLRVRAHVATDTQNMSELMAILGALQNDIEIPPDGIVVPCEDFDHWEPLAFLQNVHPDAWLYAAPASRGGLSEEEWFADEAYSLGLTYTLEQILTHGSAAGFAQFTFIGPDGMPYSKTTYREGASAGTHGPIELPRNSVQLLYKQLSTGMGMVMASAEALPNVTQFANLERMDPPMYGAEVIMFEFETASAPAEADHGDNILLAEWDPRPNFPIITGPLRQPSTRPGVTLGVSPARLRPTARVAANRNRAPLPQWLRDRFARGRANEARTLREEGLTKNTTPYRTASGRVTIPDSLSGGRISEVKDRLSVFLSGQIRAQLDMAKARGMPYRLYVGTNTHVSPTITAQARSLGVRMDIVRLPYLGRGD